MRDEKLRKTFLAGLAKKFPHRAKWQGAAGGDAMQTGAMDAPKPAKRPRYRLVDGRKVVIEYPKAGEEGVGAII